MNKLNKRNKKFANNGHRKHKVNVKRVGYLVNGEFMYQISSLERFLDYKNLKTGSSDIYRYKAECFLDEYGDMKRFKVFNGDEVIYACVEESGKRIVGKYLGNIRDRFDSQNRGRNMYMMGGY